MWMFLITLTTELPPRLDNLPDSFTTALLPPTKKHNETGREGFGFFITTKQKSEQNMFTGYKFCCYFLSLFPSWVPCLVIFFCTQFLLPNTPVFDVFVLKSKEDYSG